VKRQLEPKLDPLFHVDSYGYRPTKSAPEAVGRARLRIPTQTGHQSDLKSDSVPIQSGQCSD
jgi:retron-type reverse transcriptase